MAKLSVHGAEIGRINYLTYSYAYMADGVKLVNRGDGWKVKGKLKAGLSPESAYNTAKASHSLDLISRPAFAAYRKELHSLAGMGKAAKLHLAVGMMPEDCDGVWSEACDGYGDNVHADLDEIGDLCGLYRAAMAEKVELAQIGWEIAA